MQLHKRKTVGILLCAILLLVLSLCGCQQEKAGASSQNQATVSTISYPSRVPYTVRVVRNWFETSTLPSQKAKCFRTKEAWDSFVETERQSWILEDQYGWNNSPFTKAAARYDEEYFKENILILYLQTESSGSNQVEIDGLENTDRGTSLYVRCTYPKSGTADMAYWQFFIEVEKEQLADSFSQGEPEIQIQRIEIDKSLSW